MRRYYASSSLHEADRLASEQFFIPGEVLMENAGSAASEEIRRFMPTASRVLILCGPGSNGGDGFVVARHLLLEGWQPLIISTAKEPLASGVAVQAAACGITIHKSAELRDDDIRDLWERADVVVDALLGTGSQGTPRGEVARIIKIGREMETSCVALDIPSGVDPDSGVTAGEALSAACTVTFLAGKPGLFVTPGANHAGRVVVRQIGVPPGLVLSSPPLLTGYDRDDIPALTPRIEGNVHKGKKGRVLIVGGSENYRGAPLLAALGAFAAGCGVVALAVPECVAAPALLSLPEVIFEPIASLDEGSLVPLLAKYDSAVVGPGMGRSKPMEELVRLFWRNWTKPLLVDADGLFHLSVLAATQGRDQVIDQARDHERGQVRGETDQVSEQVKDEGLPYREDAIITPHEGEAARLLAITADEVAGERMRAVGELADRFSVALLKGYHTLVAAREETRVILEGTSALATAGSGDVLSGVIGTCMAQGLAPLAAATLGALLHGAAGSEMSGQLKPLLASGIAAKVACMGATG